MKNPHKETRSARTWDEALFLLRQPEFREGYLQARDGRRLDHDHIPEQTRQMRFEAGRAFCAHLRSKNITPPPWPSVMPFRIPHVIQCVAMDCVRDEQAEAA